MNTVGYIPRNIREFTPVVNNFLCVARSSLGVSQLDSVIIAPPPLLDSEVQTLTHLQPLWEELESLIHSKKVAAIGTSDLDKTLLEQLYNWAQVCCDKSVKILYYHKSCTRDALVLVH